MIRPSMTQNPTTQAADRITRSSHINTTITRPLIAPTTSTTMTLIIVPVENETRGTPGLHGTNSAIMANLGITEGIRGPCGERSRIDMTVGVNITATMIG